MKMLGKTLNGKAVNTNDDLTIEQLFDMYKNFVTEDHWDAACIWTVFTVLDHPQHYRNKEFHLASIGLTAIDIVSRVSEMMQHGRMLLGRSPYVEDSTQDRQPQK